MEGWLIVAVLIYIGYRWGRRSTPSTSEQVAAFLAQAGPYTVGLSHAQRAAQAPVAPVTTPGQGGTQAG